MCVIGSMFEWKMLLSCPTFFTIENFTPHDEMLNSLNRLDCKKMYIKCVCAIVGLCVMETRSKRYSYCNGERGVPGM